MALNSITEAIIGAAITVHRELGPGSVHEVVGLRIQHRRLGQHLAQGAGIELTRQLLERWVLNIDRPPVDALAAELGWSTAHLYTRATRLRQALATEAEAQIRLFETDAGAVGHERAAVMRLLRED